MDKQDFIGMNKKGWNDLIKASKPFSNTILPEYGPFLKRNEDDMKIMDKMVGAKVLDIGCGSGESLEYLLNKGASDIWGIDISEEQIAKAKERFPQYSDHFVVSPMEEETSIPQDYFDYIISIFSVGYSSDLLSTLKNAYKYLKSDGSLIISWTHPFYYCLDVVDDKVVINKSYFNEDSEIITKEPDKVNLAQHNLMISTLVNTASEANFYVDKMYEEETVMEDYGNGYNSPFWKKEKTENCPSTIILKLKKKN
jgi:ubiquinone/menaquinone biosynthesis C-methylase UbiE